MLKAKKTIASIEWFSIKRSMQIILPLCMLSLLIAGIVCSVANDVYAFVKTNREIILNIDEAQSVKSFSELLGEYDIVEKPEVFDLYVRMKDKNEVIEKFSGEVILNSSMSYREILASLS